jgi:hypothetical protein
MSESQAQKNHEYCEPEQQQKPNILPIIESENPVLITVKTPFQFKLLSSPNRNKNLRVDCIPNPDITPYEIFCLRSILITKLERALGIPITVKFLRIFSDSQDIYVRVFTPEKTNREFDQKKLKIMQEIISSVVLGPRDFCVLFRHDVDLEIDENSKPIHVPHRWLSDMLSFIIKDLLRGYDYKIKDLDIYVRLNDENFEKTQVDYLTEYDNLQRAFLSRIKRLFRKGTLKLSKDQTEFAQKWLLKKVCDLETGDAIYEAQWFDKRFFNEESGENMTKFLLNRLVKDYVFIPDIEFSSTQYRTEICNYCPYQRTLNPTNYVTKKTKQYIKKVKGRGTKVFIDNLEDLWYLYGHLRHIEKDVCN